jgi:hypothetical protein
MLIIGETGSLWTAADVSGLGFLAAYSSEQASRTSEAGFP